MSRTTDNSFDRNLGANIRTIRIRRGISQEELGDILNVSFQQIQKYEAGKDRLSAEKLVHIAHFLDISLEHLLSDLWQQPPALNTNMRCRRLVMFFLDQLTPAQSRAVLGIVKLFAQGEGRGE